MLCSYEKSENIFSARTQHLLYSQNTLCSGKITGEDKTSCYSRDIMNENFPSAGFAQNTLVEEAPPITTTQEEKQNEPYGYSGFMRRILSLEKSVPEAQRILFGERPPRTAEGRIMDKLKRLHEGALKEAEAGAYSKQPIYEKKAVMYAQYVEAKMKMLGLYFDHLKLEEDFKKRNPKEIVPPKFLMSNLIADDNPWIGKMKEDDSQEFSQEVEFLSKDDYSSEETGLEEVV